MTNTATITSATTTHVPERVRATLSARVRRSIQIDLAFARDAPPTRGDITAELLGAIEGFASVALRITRPLTTSELAFAKRVVAGKQAGRVSLVIAAVAGHDHLANLRSLEAFCTDHACPVYLWFSSEAFAGVKADEIDALPTAVRSRLRLVVSAGSASIEDLSEHARELQSTGVSSTIATMRSSSSHQRTLSYEARGGCGRVFEPVITASGDVWSCPISAEQSRSSLRFEKASPLYLGSVHEHPVADLLDRQVSRVQLLAVLLAGPFTMVAEMAKAGRGLSGQYNDGGVLERLVDLASASDGVEGPLSYFRRVFWERKASDRVTLMVRGESVKQEGAIPPTTICELCEIANRVADEAWWRATIPPEEIDAAFHAWLNMIASTARS